MPIKVLVVDDTRVIRNSIKDFFDRDFFDIIGEASDGFEALKAYQELKPEVVTMDMNMPGCDGVKAIRMIREVDPDAYIIIISSMDDDIVRGLEAGAKACVFKPISMAKFRELMGQVVADIEKRRILRGENKGNSFSEKTEEERKEEEALNKSRTSHKYVEGVKLRQQLSGWKKQVIYKSTWAEDKLIIEIKTDLSEKNFNKLIALIKYAKEKGLETQIFYENYLKDNIKIQFLKMLL